MVYEAHAAIRKRGNKHLKHIKLLTVHLPLRRPVCLLKLSLTELPIAEASSSPASLDFFFLPFVEIFDGAAAPLGPPFGAALVNLSHRVSSLAVAARTCRALSAAADAPSALDMISIMYRMINYDLIGE